MDEEIKVLVVDDAAFMRNAVRDLLEDDAQLTVVDSAKDGLEGLTKIKRMQPDVITLDIDMPVMDGLTSIRHIMIESPIPIVVLSSLFADGAITFEALRLGVVDFVPKPSGAVSSDIDQSRQQLIDRVKLATSVNMDNIRRVRLPKWDSKQDLTERYGYRPLEYIITLGTTLSGPNTIIRLFANLSPALPAAAVVIQEISPKILASFVKEFDSHVPWKVEMAADGVALQQGTCYIGSNENSYRIAQNANGEPCIQMEALTEKPLNLLFTSAADTFQQNTVGVLLTGLGKDGAEGFMRIREKSGVTMAQDTKCCVYPNLTENAIEKDTVDIIINETKLPEAISAIMN
jgi:two-component system chemotaxis response regulator CheB